MQVNLFGWRLGQRSERCGHHARDLVRLTVQCDRLSKDRGISQESASPQVVGEDHDARRPWPMFFRPLVTCPSLRVDTGVHSLRHALKGPAGNHRKTRQRGQGTNFEFLLMTHTLNIIHSQGDLCRSEDV
jgi:hypothetical protein